MRFKFGLVVLASAAALLAGCGSDEDKMARGLSTSSEVAVPISEKQLEMTEAERRAAAEDEEERQEAKLFKESQQ
jgi:outer membrane biogenesis lipoprotein LolB